VSPVKYELGFYIPEDDTLHSHCRENLKSYTLFCMGGVCTLLVSTSIGHLQGVQNLLPPVSPMLWVSDHCSSKRR
jgi:hypothetical protein